MKFPRDNGFFTTIKSLAKTSPYAKGEIKDGKLFGSPEMIAFERTADGLIVTFTKTKPCDLAYVLKIIGLNMQGIS